MDTPNLCQMHWRARCENMACSAPSFRVTGKGNATAELTQAGSVLVLCHSTTCWGSPSYCHGKTQPEKSHLRADPVPWERSPGAWIRNTGPPVWVWGDLRGNLSAQGWRHPCTHTCAHCYYHWGETRTQQLWSLHVEMPQHPLLGTAGACHSKATCICTACPRASVCPMPAKALQGQSWAIRAQSPKMPFLRDGGEQRKAFPLKKKKENFSLSFYHFVTYCQKKAQISPYEKARHRKCHISIIINAVALLSLPSELLHHYRTHLIMGWGSRHIRKHHFYRLDLISFSQALLYNTSQLLFKSFQK